MPDNLTDPSHSTEQFRAFASGTAEPSTGSMRNRLVVIGAIVVAVVIIVVIALAV